jgi:ElaA protein
MINWSLKKFADLSPDELYAILRLRSEVFVIEQTCIFQDMDNKDQRSHHLMGWQDDTLLAYTRLVPAGLAFELASIGRVVTSSKTRGTGAGRQLMLESIRQINNLYGEVPIRIGAQVYLRHFYESFGFKQTSDIYDEDGIDHIEMTRD